MRMKSEYTDKVTPLRPRPQIVARAEHNISRDAISENALKVLYRLKNAGYQSCLVGGSVRDLLLGREPKDFDVATNAHPEQVRELFRNCRLIGRRFRLAHVRFGAEVIEVSTFRAAHHVSDLDGRIVRDNVYGSIDDDVWRRDFTANALFYNIDDFSVVDYVGGLADIRAGLIRLIGDPEQRYREDPVRLLRAVRFAVKLGFRIHPETERPIRELAPLLEAIPSARLFEEFLKLFLSGCAVQTFEALRHHDLFGALFPETEVVLGREENGFPQTLVIHALRDTDQRLAESRPVTPGFLLAAMLWPQMHSLAGDHVARGLGEFEAVELAADAVISRQVARTAIPRRFTQMAREIWQFQPRLMRGAGRRPQRLLSHPRFRAAYDFLLLRNRAGENLRDACEWWTTAQKDAPATEVESEAAESPARPRRRRRRSGRRGNTT
ncbi:MAG: polynucleotide adenylyltransferase PcnB [Gammaproteobacteria bacterium]|nr:polynucleotide adenylyltransferase PcnB [Gammaproteobacteria bacterium]